MFKTHGSYLYLVLALITMSTFGMEFTDEYPFNVKHSKEPGVYQVGRLMTGFFIGGYAGAGLGAVISTLPLACYKVYQEGCFLCSTNQYVKVIDHLGANPLVATSAGIGFVSGVVYGLYSQISHINRKARLYELVGDQTFLDIIKTDNDIYAYAWLQSCYNSHITAKDNTGKTALMHAVIHDARKVALVLIKAGASISTQDNEGKTAFDYAQEQRNQEMMRLLIS